MKLIKFVIGVIFGISVFIVTLWTAIEIPTYNISFYEKQYVKNNTYDEIQISKEDLSKVTHIIIDYLKCKTDQLNTNVTIHNQLRPFYNEKELDHMKDVQNLFRFFITLRNMAAVFIVLCLGYVFFSKCRWERIRHLLKYLRNTFIAIFIAAIAIIALIATNFSYYFEMFHLIFFSNDLWILDPATDMLINIVPLPFFIAMASYIGYIFMAAAVCIVVFASLFLAVNHKE